jgi:hypothetical protein
MDVHGSFDLRGNLLKNTGIAPVDNFPSNPKPGTWVHKDKRIYACIDLDGDGTPLYVPITQELNLVEAKVTTPSLEWVIDHQLNVARCIVQVYDENGSFFIPDSIDCSTINRVVIGFSMPMRGTALIQSGETVGRAKPSTAFEQTFTSSTTWVVNHMLGFDPSITCIIDGYVAIPLTVEYTTAGQVATITWSSAKAGSVRCV